MYGMKRHAGDHAMGRLGPLVQPFGPAVQLCFLEWLQWLQWSPHPQLLDVVWCSAVVVVVVV